VPRVFDFFAEKRLTPGALRASYRRQVELLAASFDVLTVPDDVVTRDRETPLERFGAFLALRSTRAAQLQRALAGRGVLGSVAGGSLAQR
jgi:kynureninase